MKKFIKLVVCIFLVFLAVLGFENPPAYADDFIFDCEGQADGDYQHPYDCTKFISCSNERPYEMSCVDCNSVIDGEDRCPNGKLHFSKELHKCEWADVAKCTLGESTSFFYNPFKSTVNF